MKPTEPLIRPRAILFDMDGTLTEPYLDFDAMKAEMGIPNQPILETLAKMNNADRAKAEAILHRHEEQAAVESTLNPGCVELLTWLKTVGIETALITRNTRRSVETVFDRHELHFDICITREDGKFKPDPAPLLLACERLKMTVNDAWMVGDSYHDIDAGLAARVKTVWLSHGKTRNFAGKPWKTVRDLVELTKLLRECLN